MELRPLVAADESAWVRMLESSREAWAAWTPAPDPALGPSERFRLELDRCRRGGAAGTHLRLAGVLPDGSLVGHFALNEIVRGVFQNAYASWQVAAGHMGRGFGTEGVRALLDLGFDARPEGVGLHRVQAAVMPANAPSLRVVDKVGFRHEGTARRYLLIAGRWEDHELFALTREEWQAAS